MELKEQLLASFIAFEEGIDQKNPVHDKRVAALAYFEEMISTKSWKLGSTLP